GIRDLIVTGVQTCALPIFAAKCAPQDVQCLAQCRSRVLLVELRPEQGEQAVAAVESSGSGGGEVGEQRETARSSEQPLDLVSRRSEERRVGKEWRSRWSTE